MSKNLLEIHHFIYKMLPVLKFIIKLLIRTNFFNCMCHDYSLICLKHRRSISSREQSHETNDELDTH